MHTIGHSRFLKKIAAEKAEDARVDALIATGAYEIVSFSPRPYKYVVRRIPGKELPLCGAKCRDGSSCQSRAVLGKTRCKMHGGKSTGPRSAAGRKAIGESNSRRTIEKRIALLREGAKCLKDDESLKKIEAKIAELSASLAANRQENRGRRPDVSSQRP